MRLLLKRVVFFKPIYLFTFILSCFIYIYIAFYKPKDLDRTLKLTKIDEFIKKNSSVLACQQPKLRVDAPEIMKFIKKSLPFDCSSAGPDWVKCENYNCWIQEDVKTIFGKIECYFTDIIRKNDYYTASGETTFSDSYYKLEASDVVQVSCSAKYKKWSAVRTGVRYSKAVWDQVNKPVAESEDLSGFNVLMFGFDSLSRNTWIRKLPKSYDYFVNTLKGEVLQGYNIVGDGTPQALIPILTGKTELELPDTRKRIADSQFVNSYPFIWNDYKGAGYVTAFYEDLPDTGTFTYRLNGFNETPTDHYMRSYYLASKHEESKWPEFCTGDTPRHMIMFNQIKNFFSVYENEQKFLFAFHGELSHDDYNLVGSADNDLLELLKDLKESKALENTVLILMADHGHRFTQIRNTLQGKQEERLPFFSFRFPEKFKRKFQYAYKNFRNNVNRLTTPFDIYSTLKDLLRLNKEKRPKTNVAKVDYSRSISLFTEIPADRSCAMAYIEPHWCACLEWETISLSNPIVNRVGEALINAINSYTQPHREYCEFLKIGRTNWVTKLAPNENLVKFKKNADLDGFVADLSGRMEIKSHVYQISLLVLPGKSFFEASVKYYIFEDKFEVNIKDISRINRYGQQARCVEYRFPDLRKYCYCKH